MGRYTGPKGRINRRLSALIFEDAGASQALEKRDTPPGMSTRRKKLTTYGAALAEKQKIKYYFGLREKQLRRYFDKARRMKGNSGEQLLVLCERRLDNVVRRAGFCNTRPQARQAIVHGHFQLNSQTVNKPSISVRAGDVVTVRKRPNLQHLYKEHFESNTIPACDWIGMDVTSMEARILTLPSFDDVSLPVDVGQVVALISR